MSAHTVVLTDIGRSVGIVRMYSNLISLNPNVWFFSIKATWTGATIISSDTLCIIQQEQTKSKKVETSKLQSITYLHDPILGDHLHG